MELNKIAEPLITTFNKQKQIFEPECTPPYSVNIRLKVNSQNGIFIDLPQIKKSANYLNPERDKIHPPKDCDGIIIDQDSNTIYLIELKHSRSSSTPDDIKEQLNAGESWLKHIAFCISLDLDEYEIIKVAVIVTGSRSKGRQYKVGNKGYYRVNGNSIMCEYFG